MRWPEEITVSGIPIKISRLLQGEVAVLSGDDAADGTVDLVNLAAVYSNDLSGPYRDVIIYHEIFHILEYILFAGHVEIDEKVVQAFALAFREIIEQLVEYNNA